MSIEYQNKPIDWDNAGVTPPQDLIEKGFQPGYKPPAEYFNALLHTTSEAIKEIQEKTVELANTVDEGAGGASEHTDSVTQHITDATCTYASSVYTLTPSKAVGNASYFCLRFKAPNDYAASASFKIGTKTYTAVNAAFKQNDVVILNFDVSQSKCFFVSGGAGENRVGQNVEGQTFVTADGNQTAKQGAERFNMYHSDGNIAIGLRAHAENSNTQALADDTHAGGLYSIAKGQTSFTHGQQTEANGRCSVSFGHSAKANGFCSGAIGCDTIANRDYTFVTGQKNKDFIEKDYFIVGNGNENYNGLKSNCFRVSSYGVYAVGEYAASGADYAEMFEWADGNPDNEDRRGLFVTLDGEKIRPVRANDDYILGVVSATPSVVADAQTDDWGKKWKTDVFGERLLDDNGAWILNEDFREEDNESYVSRLERKEWAAVGLVGKLIIVDDGTCEVNGYCSPANGGTATKSETGYRVLSRIDESHIKVLVK